MRPAEGAQRGSVMDMPVYPGDPQTPGVGAKPGVKLIPLDQVQTITKIPVLPISYADAQPFLKSLEGQTVPENWRGDLPFTYRTGPSKARLISPSPSTGIASLSTTSSPPFPAQPSPTSGSFAAIITTPGSTAPKIPSAAQALELEEARALGELLKQGWKPARTIIYCFWDGEEPALLGSTEWAEFHADELKQHAVAYFNSDGNGRGFFHAGGSHSLENFINSVAKDIDDPETKMSVWKRARLAARLRGTPESRAEAKSRADSRIGALGSGSDYTVFIDHLGVPSVNLGLRRRRRRRRPVPLRLRRLLLLHPFPGHRIPLRKSPRANRRHHDDAHGRRRRPALPVH